MTVKITNQYDIRRFKVIRVLTQLSQKMDLHTKVFGFGLIIFMSSIYLVGCNPESKTEREKRFNEALSKSYQFSVEPATSSQPEHAVVCDRHYSLCERVTPIDLLSSHKVKPPVSHASGHANNHNHLKKEHPKCVP